MNSFKEAMIRNVERGYCSYSDAYSYTHSQLLSHADDLRLRAKEEPNLPERNRDPLPDPREASSGESAELLANIVR